jgi:peptide chain release factor subunit 3
MQSWELAGIVDVDPKERKTGRTVEYAKVNFTCEHRRFTVFDVPGHQNYVPNLIMGASQADIAVLIISSKEGQF